MAHPARAVDEILGERMVDVELDFGRNHDLVVGREQVLREIDERKSLLFIVLLQVQHQVFNLVLGQEYALLFFQEASEFSGGHASFFEGGKQ